MYCTSFLLVELVFWIPIISGILQAQESPSLIPNYTDRNPDSFTWGWAGGGEGDTFYSNNIEEKPYSGTITGGILDYE